MVWAPNAAGAVAAPALPVRPGMLGQMLKLFCACALWRCLLQTYAWMTVWLQAAGHRQAGANHGMCINDGRHCIHTAPCAHPKNSTSLKSAGMCFRACIMRSSEGAEGQRRGPEGRGLTTVWKGRARSHRQVACSIAHLCSIHQVQLIYRPAVVEHCRMDLSGACLDRDRMPGELLGTVALYLPVNFQGASV